MRAPFAIIHCNLHHLLQPTLPGLRFEGDYTKTIDRESLGEGVGIQLIPGKTRVLSEYSAVFREEN